MMNDDGDDEGDGEGGGETLFIQLRY